MGKDLCEAHAADRMRCMMRHRLVDFEQPEPLFGLMFIEHALALKMMLAVHRTLQGASGDKASFARLLSLTRTAAPGVNFSGITERLSEMRNGEAARKLQRCRNRFMAHTLVGELASRGGMKSDLVEDLLDDFTHLYEEIRRGISGTKAWAESEGLSECREKWHTGAQKTCDTLLGSRTLMKPRSLRSR